MTKSYNGLPMIARFIIQLFLGYVVAPIYRICRFFENKKLITLIYGLLSLVLCPLFWIIDLITTVLHGKITILVE